MFQEEELRKEGGKYSHLNEELHVLVEFFGLPTECYSRMAHALNELRVYLIPVSMIHGLYPILTVLLLLFVIC